MSPLDPPPHIGKKTFSDEEEDGESPEDSDSSDEEDGLQENLTGSESLDASSEMEDVEEEEEDEEEEALEGGGRAAVEARGGRASSSQKGEDATGKRTAMSNSNGRPPRVSVILDHVQGGQPLPLKGGSLGAGSCRTVRGQGRKGASAAAGSSLPGADPALTVDLTQTRPPPAGGAGTTVEGQPVARSRRARGSKPRAEPGKKSRAPGGGGKGALPAVDGVPPLSQAPMSDDEIRRVFEFFASEGPSEGHISGDMILDKAMGLGIVYDEDKVHHLGGSYGDILNGSIAIRSYSNSNKCFADGCNQGGNTIIR